MRRLLTIFAIAAETMAGSLRSGAAEVVLNFEAVVQSVPFDSPFGLTPSIGTPVTGWLSFETADAIDSDSSPDRGVYRLGIGGGFLASILGHEITGSMKPRIDVENFDFASDTFRFVDGASQSPFQEGTMAFDGTASEDIGLSLSITDADHAAFDDDELPSVFPMEIEPDGATYFHTFVLRDDRGSMSLEIFSLRQFTPPPLAIKEVGFEGDDPFIAISSRPGMCYDIEFSTDLTNWEVIALNYPDDGFTTDFIDTGLIGRVGSRPLTAYYRVKESQK